MKLTWVSLCMTVFLCNQADSKDFGTFGHTYSIDEPDLMQEIQTKLMNMEETGVMKHHQQEIIEKTKRSLANPPALKDLTRATQDRTFYFDPSIVVPYDLKDHEGRIFQRAGTRVNPLGPTPLRCKLVFIQGDDETQVQWAQETYFDQDIKVKVILVSGGPFALMESWEKPVFFDQGGVITTKLGIRTVPAVVEQEGSKLKISEIHLKEASK
jgi:conjugal transfer pilus assembly protein TraW